jgi:lipoprotein-anchoring transpeptidase ErfK/SrfK
MRARLTSTRTLLAVTAAMLLLASCGGSGSERAAVPSTTSTIPVPPPVVTATVTDGATDVPVAKPIGITVAKGTLKDVSLALGAGGTAPAPGAGVFNAGRTGWLSSANFAPHTPYRISATVLDAVGHATRRQWSFTTGAPTKELHTTLNVGDDGTYGVGMPIIVTLNSSIPDALRKSVTDRLTITSTPPVTGSWRWFTDTEMHFRPSVYWPAHTKVSLKIDFAGLDVGGGTWGVDGRTVAFGIGDSHISVVDAAAHTMTVQENGKPIRTFPISAGNDKYPTRSGIHVVNEKSQSVVMDSATVGIPRDSPDGYYETVLWDVRISNSGEFVHAAPWSVGSQGSANVSHGCVNASDADAQWFYNYTMNGDVVQVLNTPVQLEPWNGYGDWQVPYDQWAN